MNLLDFAITPLWLVWESVRELAAEDGVELAESELIGLAPLRGLPRRRGPGRRAERGSGRTPPGGRRPLPAAARLLADAGPRAPARGRPGRRPDLVSGGPFRLIHGGRNDEPTPGLLIVGAAEVVTLAGGVRMGEAQGDVGRLTAADVGGPDAPDAPVVACWEGRIAAVGPAGGAGGRARGGGLPARTVRPARRRWRDGHARAHRSAHPPAVRRVARGRVAPPPAGRGLSRDPRGRRRDPVDRRRDPGRRPGRADGPRPAVARRDARPRRHDDRGEVRLRPRPRDGDPAASRPPTGSARRARSTSIPTYLGAHAVPPEFRTPARRHRGLRPVDHRGAAARGGGARPGAVLRRLLRGRGVRPGPVPADPGGGRRLRAADPAPRRRAGPVGRGRAGGRARRRLGGPPGDAIRGRDRCARRWPPPRIERSWRPSCRRRPGSS